MKKYITCLFLFITLFFCGCNFNNPYNNENNWAYYAVGQNKNVDLFIIAPTVYLGDSNNFNMSLTDDETKKNFLGALNMERGIYEKNCRMFAPYYKQASLSAYKIPQQKSNIYFNIAYNDIKQAFEFYLKNCNNDRPIILAGFSQGANMSLRLLKDYFASNKNLYNKLVAAYIIGWRVNEYDLVGNLKMANNENDTGCIISFNSESIESNYSIIVPDKTLAINPLNWKTDNTIANKNLNLGACFTDYEGNITKEIKNLTGAYIDSKRGTLKIIDIDKKDYPAILDIFEDGNYHIYDYQFFYRNLQKNVSDRIENYLSNINN